MTGANKAGLAGVWWESAAAPASCSCAAVSGDSGVNRLSELHSRSGDTASFSTTQSVKCESAHSAAQGAATASSLSTVSAHDPVDEGEKVVMGTAVSEGRWSEAVLVFFRLCLAAAKAASRRLCHLGQGASGAGGERPHVQLERRVRLWQRTGATV